MTLLFFFFFFNDTATTEIYTLSLHDALPICLTLSGGITTCIPDEYTSAEAMLMRADQALYARSEEHTSELQSPCNLVCRLLLEKKKRMFLQSLRPALYQIFRSATCKNGRLPL